MKPPRDFSNEEYLRERNWSQAPSRVSPEHWLWWKAGTPFGIGEATTLEQAVDHQIELDVAALRFVFSRRAYEIFAVIAVGVIVDKLTEWWSWR